jgi:hypothetical protein
MSVWSFLFIVNLTVYSATNCNDTDNKKLSFVRNFYNLVFPAFCSNDIQQLKEYIESLEDFFLSDPIECLSLVREHWDYKFKYLFWMRNYPILLDCHLGNKLRFTLTMISDIFVEVNEEIQKKYQYLKLYDKESQSINFKCIDVMISMVCNIRIETLKMPECDEKARENLLFRIDESLKVWGFIRDNLSFDLEGGIDYHSFFDSFEKIRRCVLRGQDLCTESRSLCILFMIYSSIVRFCKCRRLFDFGSSEKKPFVAYMIIIVFRIYPIYSGILNSSYFIYDDFKKILFENTEGKLRIFKKELESPFHRHFVIEKRTEKEFLRPFSYLCYFIDSLGNDDLAWKLLALRELERFILAKSR